MVGIHKVIGQYINLVTDQIPSQCGFGGKKKKRKANWFTIGV